MNNKPHLLFVCVENSNRSQMAEAFARLHGGDRVAVYSAGSQPSGVVHSKAVAAMREKGVDLLATQHSNGLDDLPQVTWDWVITLGCGDACSHLPARNRNDWPLPSPKDFNPDDFNKVRDETERRVVALLKKC